MNAIDDDFLISVLKSNEYKFPLKKHRQKIQLELGLLILKAIACAVLFSLVYLGINSASILQHRNPNYVLSGLILLVVIILFIKELKQAQSLLVELFTNDFGIEKDILVNTSQLVSRKENKSIQSACASFKENGLVEILSSSENYDYYLKRKKYTLKPKRKYKSKIAIPYETAHKLFGKLENSPEEKEVILVKTIQTEQLIAVLFFDEIGN